VSCVWKQAEQNKNAKEIARVSGLLYDKLVGFVEDFQKIKRNLDAADRAYDDAFGKLKDGRGNLLVTANRVKDLGANTNKQLPSNLVDEDTKLIDEE
jgi:DNA recombination protein RmuC